jgi:hypothetical protein
MQVDTYFKHNNILYTEYLDDELLLNKMMKYLFNCMLCGSYTGFILIKFIQFTNITPN